MKENISGNELNQLPKLSKKTQIFHNIAGIKKSEKGEYEEAIQHFTKAIRLDPNNAISYFNRATLKIRIGDIEGARSDFKMSEYCHRNADFQFEDYPLL
ncbi:MAG: tetratricopeptide repeat protein [Ignavibacteria bacterium]|nr:tetratricopeptide repeat protein [Ignavibacteria bacterium]